MDVGNRPIGVMANKRGWPHVNTCASLRCFWRLWYFVCAIVFGVRTKADRHSSGSVVVARQSSWLPCVQMFSSAGRSPAAFHLSRTPRFMAANRVLRSSSSHPVTCTLKKSNKG